jgi:hypothetical protein
VGLLVCTHTREVGSRQHGHAAIVCNECVVGDEGFHRQLLQRVPAVCAHVVRAEESHKGHKEHVLDLAVGT